MRRCGQVIKILRVSRAVRYLTRWRERYGINATVLRIIKVCRPSPSLLLPHRDVTMETSVEIPVFSMKRSSYNCIRTAELAR